MLNMKTEQIIANKVRAWCDKHKVNRQDYIATILSHKLGRRLSHDTIVRIYNGETGINLQTAAIITTALGALSISDLFDVS